MWLGWAEMACDICQDTGIAMLDIGTATIPDYIETICVCQPPEPDEPSGTSYDDFHPFHDARYEGF